MAWEIYNELSEFNFIKSLQSVSWPSFLFIKATGELQGLVEWLIILLLTTYKDILYSFNAICVWLPVSLCIFIRVVIYFWHQQRLQNMSAFSVSNLLNTISVFFPSREGSISNFVEILIKLFSIFLIYFYFQSILSWLNLLSLESPLYLHVPR